MRRGKLIGFIVTLLLTLVMLQTVQAMVVRLPGGWISDVRLCRDGYSVHVTGNIDTSGTTAEVNVISTSIPGQIGQVLSITALSDAYPVDVTKVFLWDSPQTPGTIVDNIRMNRLDNGVLIDERDADAPDVIGNCDVVSPGGVFLGDPQNLVLIPVATGIYDAPNGSIIATMDECKTAFVLQEQDGFYEIAVMGGWIQVASTIDVGEDYGQPGGSPTYGGCEGK